MRSLLFLAAAFSALLPCTSGMLFPLAQASEFSGGSAYQYFSLQETTRDIAVTSIVQVGPPFVNEGNIVTINIGVSNYGTEQETFSVGLRDDTAGESIASKEVVLAAGGSTILSIPWDTKGATGGPAPPGPPTPGTIHSLTAVATLAGDTVEGNNSMSLLPGIWVIAAPKPIEITFPVNSEVPEARTIVGLDSDMPGVGTVEEPLVETYVSPVLGQQGVTFSDPSIGTSMESLSNIYSSIVEDEEGAALGKPEITTVMEPLSKISTDEVGTKVDKTIVAPAIGTSATPLNAVFLYQSNRSAVASVSVPTIATQADDLAKIFAIQTHSQVAGALTRPEVDTDTAVDEVVADNIVSDVGQAELTDSLEKPIVATDKERLTFVFDSRTEGDAEGDLRMQGFRTAGVALNSVFRSAVGASLLHQGIKPEFAIESVSENLPQLNVEEEIKEPKALAANITETGTIRGRIKLQGRISSLGSYVEIGGQVTFVDRHGYFLIERPAGSFNLKASAPGYLSHEIRNINVEPGDTLVMPMVTLPFGDADGDGIVDILDLTVAARNFGQTASAIWYR